MRRAPYWDRGKSSGRREIERETKGGRESGVKSSGCWLNRPRRERKGNREESAGELTRRGGSRLGVTATRASPRPRGTARPCASPTVREDPRGPAHLRRPRDPASSVPLRGPASAGPRPHAAPPPLWLRVAPRVLCGPASVHLLCNGQGVRHYGAPFNRDASARELSRRMQKMTRRLDIPEEKPSVEEILKSLRKGHEKFEFGKEFRQVTNGVMVIGSSITFGVIIYYHVP